MSKENFKWAYFFALPMSVLSLSVNLYRVSNYWCTLTDLIMSLREYLSRMLQHLHTLSYSCNVCIPHKANWSPSVCWSQLSRLITTEEYHEIITTLLFVLGHFWYMFFCNYLGQEVINHSGDIFHRMWVTYTRRE